MSSERDRHDCPQFLFNPESRRRLVDQRLQALLTRGIDLETARRLALGLGLSGSRLYLLAQLNAAISCCSARYLEHYGFQPGRRTLQFRGRAFPLASLANTCALFQQHYQLPDIPEPAQLIESDNRQTLAGRQQLIAAICLLNIQTENPALQDLIPLFREADPASRSRFEFILDHLSSLPFDPQAAPPWGQPLKSLLLSPVKASPHDLAGQVAYVIAHWRHWLPTGLLRNLEVGAALLREEAVIRAPGPGPAPLPDYRAGLETWEPAAFSADTDWMPNVVLIAKSVHVWLGQLGRQHQSNITTLDQIPDRELDRLAGWGFNALWLIGIWERSPASRRIKQMRGNPEAEASAYALHSYRVAGDLGGEPALADLEGRCAARGIRLACDVVPNHTGIDAEWVREHPDWYIQDSAPPYPGYRFMGPDLCEDAEISVRIEDGYWDHSDAAVVFEHVDHRNGRRRYLYHGNDGTHMPWNDTAQLNFLLPEVRQAMSDLIVATARRFRLIRFDAAMTLARKHFRRLWFPPPGGSAGVPSRSAFWMTDEDFAAAFPVEFWREVVDRIGREAPDTLLIAEAFWLMESYFVRNLGMHRVYNSAFMHLLKREENAKFRKILKDTLAYNPEILKRYVNFMNNPDEATAVEQFGKGDKYFGTAALLATLPGLPMFGHGQMEGYREKYGMEFRRAYWEEMPDEGFVAHHEAQICPLLRQRHLFADIARFAFYDLATAQGVNENVIAFSNGTAQGTCLVIFNNCAEPAGGKISISAPKADPDREGEAVPGRPLDAELGLELAGDIAFCRFRDHGSGLEFLRPAKVLREGLTVSLQGYQYQILYDFRTLTDPQGKWARLYRHLGDVGAADLDATSLRFRQPELWQATQRLFAAERLQELAGKMVAYPFPETTLVRMDKLSGDFGHWLQTLAAAAVLPTFPYNGEPLRLRLQLMADRLRKGLADPVSGPGLQTLWAGSEALQNLAGALLGWQLLEQCLQQACPPGNRIQFADNLDDLGIAASWRQGAEEEVGQSRPMLAELLLRTAACLPHPSSSLISLQELITDLQLGNWLGINDHNGETWFDRDRMLRLCGALVLQNFLLPTGSVVRLTADLVIFRRRVQRVQACGCRLDEFLVADGRS